MLQLFKPVLALGVVLAVVAVEGCSTNPATGENQFAALMSPGQETSVGAQEHEKIMQQYGGVVKNAALTAYVSRVGARVAADTERPDVKYQFFLLDTPVVNAFALPGGYVYVTRGILALADNEAQLASVLAHEIGHVTARHSAERYSHGVVTSLGAAILSAALDSKTATQAAGLGSQLYLSSYSRKQETQADDLGIRYLHRAGYDTKAMAQFLNNLDRFSKFEAQEAGQSAPAHSYFATHPQTDDRAAQAITSAGTYAANAGETGRDAYLKMVNGMVFGDSAEQGFVRNNVFWHPGMNFTFSVPESFTLNNGSSEIIAKDKDTGTVVLFDSAASGGADVATYLRQNWMKGEALANVESIDINGKPAATASFAGTVNNQPVTIRLVAVQWSQSSIFRFQIAIPRGAESRVTEGLKRMTYSLRTMTESERQSIKPNRVRIVTAKAGDTAATLSSSQPYTRLNEERFRAINGLPAGQNVTAGQSYKVIAAQ